MIKQNGGRQCSFSGSSQFILYFEPFPYFFFLPALSFAKKGDRLVVLLSVLVPKVFKVLLVLEVPKSGTLRTTRWGICVSVSCF